MGRQDNKNENPREGCGSGRLQRVWRAPTWGQGQKNAKKSKGKQIFHEIDFPMTVFSEIWARLMNETLEFKQKIHFSKH
jgi:hypothetical protein